jgi:hypothetical protein
LLKLWAFLRESLRLSLIALSRFLLSRRTHVFRGLSLYALSKVRVIDAWFHGTIKYFLFVNENLVFRSSSKIFVFTSLRHVDVLLHFLTFSFKSLLRASTLLQLWWFKFWIILIIIMKAFIKRATLLWLWMMTTVLGIALHIYQIVWWNHCFPLTIGTYLILCGPYSKRSRISWYYVSHHRYLSIQSLRQLIKHL